jgi:hypothetical protein
LFTEQLSIGVIRVSVYCDLEDERSGGRLRVNHTVSAYFLAKVVAPDDQGCNKNKYYHLVSRDTAEFTLSRLSSHVFLLRAILDIDVSYPARGPLSLWSGIPTFFDWGCHMTQTYQL